MEIADDGDVDAESGQALDDLWDRSGRFVVVDRHAYQLGPGACERDDLHEAHGEAPLRGRTPRSCPTCLRALLTPYSCACGWTRDGRAASAGPWVLCPSCDLFAAPKDDCEVCGGRGVVPRLRFGAGRDRGVM